LLLFYAGEVQELFEGSETQPSIVVVTPGDREEEEHLPTILRDDGPNPRPKIVQTSRPPLQ